MKDSELDELLKELRSERDNRRILRKAFPEELTKEQRRDEHADPDALVRGIQSERAARTRELPPDETEESPEADELAPEEPPVLREPEPEDTELEPESVPEDAEPEPEDTEPENVPEDTEPESKKREKASKSVKKGKTPRRVRDTVVGAVLLVLAAVGLFTIARAGIRAGARLFSGQQRRDEAARTVLPLVLMDIGDFSSPGEISDEHFLTAAILSLIVSDKLEQYPEDFETRAVPKDDVIAAGNEIFGTNRQPDCVTLSFTGDLRFYYNESEQNYLLPSDAVFFTYMPEIVSLDTAPDGSATAAADYRAEQPGWKKGQPAEPVKTVEYTLFRENGVWRVRAAKQID